MKKLFLIGVIVITMLAVSGLYSLGDASEIYGCYKIKNGQLRIVDSLSKCHPSENSIILGQPSGSLTAKLACVTASIKNPTDSSAEVSITNVKNVTIESPNDWRGIFNTFYLQADPYNEGEFFWGLQCKDEWINTGCSYANNSLITNDRDVSQAENGCFSDDEEAINGQIFTTCCKIVQE